MHMKKYFISGTIGFLVHAFWIIGGGFLLPYESPLNIVVVHAKNIDQKSIPVAFFYALAISVVFALIVRVILLKITKYTEKGKWYLGLSAGVGFNLAFWALVGFLYQMVSGFGF